VIRFDERDGDVGSPEFDGDAGESGAGTDVSKTFQRRRHGGGGGTGKKLPGGEEAFAEVAGDDLFRIADGGEIDARVPAEEYIDVGRYMIEVGGCELFASEEWCEQFGDARGLHGRLIVKQGREGRG